MPPFEPRALHLHTLESLLVDLMSGRQVLLSGSEILRLEDDAARSALAWYRDRGVAAWAANVNGAIADGLVDRIQSQPTTLPPVAARNATASSRRLTLRSLEAHRFAGLHKFGELASPPENYFHDFKPSVTLFEGRNASGKTSLLNAIVWGLTGEIIRPQREPERADEDYECSIAPAIEGGLDTKHKFAPVTPLPDVEAYRPDRTWIPSDTWVELVFSDEDGVILPPIRRSFSRSPTGKLVEIAPDLSVLDVDPISIRIGTVMPALLPHLRVGAESELGQAVSQLTGLAGLVDLSDHARRVKQKIDKDLIKAKLEAIASSDSAFVAIKDEISRVLEAHLEIASALRIPGPSDDKTIEASLLAVLAFLEGTQVTAFESAKTILGTSFVPSIASSRANLERSISPALSELEQIGRLPSLVRMQGLKQLSAEQLTKARAKLNELLAEARVLVDLSRDPSVAARTRLYARVASWLAENQPLHIDESKCTVCGGSLADSKDPITGKSVATHLHDAKAMATLLSQTLARWSESALGDLAQNLPEALRGEIHRDLPDHPCDLLRSAFLDELFVAVPFSGVLNSLKMGVEAAFNTAASGRSTLTPAIDVDLPQECAGLSQALRRLDKALRFAYWRQSNEQRARALFSDVLGRRQTGVQSREIVTLTGKLVELDATVRAAKPVSDSIVLVNKLADEIKKRRREEKRLAEYRKASRAVEVLLTLGDLASRQIDHLRSKLRKQAAEWRSRIYLGAFPSTAQELIDTPMGRNGELGITVRAGGVSAPA